MRRKERELTKLLNRELSCTAHTNTMRRVRARHILHWNMSSARIMCEHNRGQQLKRAKLLVTFNFAMVMNARERDKYFKILN